MAKMILHSIYFLRSFGWFFCTKHISLHLICKMNEIESNLRETSVFYPKILKNLKVHHIGDLLFQTMESFEKRRISIREVQIIK